MQVKVSDLIKELQEIPSDYSVEIVTVVGYDPLMGEELMHYSDIKVADVQYMTSSVVLKVDQYAHTQWSKECNRKKRAQGV